jgi:putative PIN family toxin of toxin-antitoxin system
MPERPRYVLDTNVLISAGLSTKGPSHRVTRWVIERGGLVMSAETVAEFSSRFVLRKRFDRYLSREKRAAFVAAVVGAADLVATTTRLTVCHDPDDDRVLELAVDSGAGFVVTGNTRDFPAEHEGILIMTPRQFLEEVVERR